MCEEKLAKGVDIEHQKMKANMKDKRSLALYNELKTTVGKEEIT
jgi:hypothetical protein